MNSMRLDSTCKENSMSNSSSNFNTFNVLITGANSLVGTNYIRYSKYKRIREVCLLENTPEDLDYTGVDVVLHVAAIVHQEKKFHESEYFRINRDLCLEVAGRAKDAGVKQFVFLSTIKVYGEFKSGISAWNENSECIPEDGYGRSKYEAELALMKLGSGDFIVSIIRTPLIYGIGVKANMLSIVKLIDTIPVLPFGKVNNKRNFTYVENLVKLIDRIIERKAPGLFIAMDNRSLSTTELVQLISAGLGKKRILFRLPRLIIKVGMIAMPKIFDRLYGSFEIDNTKTLKELDFIPPYKPEMGIERMVRDYVNQKNKKRKIRFSAL